MKVLKISATLILKCVELAILLVAVFLLFGEPADNGLMTLKFMLLKFTSIPMFWAVYKLDCLVNKWWGIKENPEDNMV